MQHCNSNIGDFSIAPLKGIALPNLSWQNLSFCKKLFFFVSVLNIGKWLSFCIVALKVGRVITLEREIKKRSKELILKIKHRRLRTYFIECNRWKSNIAINEQLWRTNNIFVYYNFKFLKNCWSLLAWLGVNIVQTHKVYLTFKVNIFKLWFWITNIKLA